MKNQEALEMTKHQQEDTGNSIAQEIKEIQALEMSINESWGRIGNYLLVLAVLVLIFFLTGKISF